MIIELPNESAVDSSVITSVRWWPSGDTVKARVSVAMKGEDRFGWNSAPSIVVYCESDEEARVLSQRVIDEWKQASQQKAV